MRRRGLRNAGLVSGAAIAVAAAVALRGNERHATARAPDPAVVRVELEGATSAAEVATGFVVASKRVVTVAHVLTPGRRLVIRTSDGHGWRGRVVRKDTRDDLALIAVAALKDAPAARLQRVAAAGTPLRILVRRGDHVSPLAAQLRRPIRATLHSPDSRPDTRLALELRARVALGDSGAPVVDHDGRIAGVVFARSSDVPTTAYAVDAAALPPLLAR